MKRPGSLCLRPAPYGRQCRNARTDASNATAAAYKTATEPTLPASLAAMVPTLSVATLDELAGLAAMVLEPATPLRQDAKARCR